MVVETTPFSLCELAPRGWLSMPRAPAASLHYVLSGEGALHMPGVPPVGIAQGDLIFVPAGGSHSLGASDGKFVSFAECKPAGLGLAHHRSGGDDADGDATGLVVLCASVSIGIRGAGPVIDLLREPVIEPGRDASVTASALELIVAEIMQPRIGSRAMVRALLLQCVIEAIRRRVEARSGPMRWIAALADLRFWPALSAVLSNPSAPHSVESMAELVGMSRSRFAEHFHRSFGAAPMEIVRNLRLQHAARLLLDGGVGIARVAELSGYASRSHFTQQFEARFGMSPGKYRRSFSDEKMSGDLS